MNDIIINDEELYKCSEEIEMFGNDIKAMQEALAVIFTGISETILIEGNVAENFKFLCQQVGALKDDFDYLLREQKMYVDNMVVEIDEADRDLYIGE